MMEAKYENYVEISDVLEDWDDVKSPQEIFVEEYDRLICKDIVAVVNKYFPNATIDEKKVMKLAKMLIAEEKKGGE